MNDLGADLSLLCRVRSRLCAVPLDHVIETMRKGPLQSLAGAPEFVLGLSLVRGEPLAVIDAGRLLGDPQGDPSRWLTLNLGARRLVLAVDAVLEVRRIPTLALTGMPPLLEEAAENVVRAVGLLDSELLFVLSNLRVLPEWVPAPVS